MHPTTEDLLAYVRKMYEDREHFWRPTHPQFIEGAFWLTQEQWDAILEAYPREHNGDAMYGHLVWGLPVHILEKNEPVELSDGRRIVYVGILKSIIILPKERPFMAEYKPVGLRTTAIDMFLETVMKEIPPETPPGKIIGLGL